MTTKDHLPRFFALSLCIMAFQVRGNYAKRKRLNCPPEGAGLVTSGDPKFPDPFHDVTAEEYSRVYNFLRRHMGLNLGPPQKATVNKASIFIMDLLAPPKDQVLAFLDEEGPQPKREAQVMIFRGDKPVPVVEEYRVGPLSHPKYAELITFSKRKNPVPFAVRPIGNIEVDAIFQYLMPSVDEEVGFILMESYGGRFTNCDKECLSISSVPKGTALLGETTRQLWAIATYSAEYYLEYPLDFAVLLDLEGSDPTKWSVIRVWYSQTYYPSLSDLAFRYRNDPRTPKTVRPLVPSDHPEEFSTIRQRGGPFPEAQQRAPVQLELDGKRYVIEHQHVTYLQWSFHFRLSALRGPQVYDVRFLEHRIAYELGLSEISVFYAGDDPFRVADYVDSGVLIGTYAKSLVEGADCPKGATFLSATFFGEKTDEPITFDRSLCVFELNTGVPLYRHMSYTESQGAFYGGMEDSALVLRTVLAIVNYDYVIDWIFRQDGSVETRAISTGYIAPSVPAGVPDTHGWTLRENLHGNLHHHTFHFKADLDIGGTYNRYETVDLMAERVTLEEDGSKYNQIKFARNLKKTEVEAVYKFNFDHPMLHLVYSDHTEFGVPKAYRLLMKGMSKQLLPENEFNERTIPWTRQQMAVTVHKDDEAMAGSSSTFALFDSLDPVVNFTEYFSDDESIVDEDLVFWFTLGTYHLPHTEDLPVTPTGGGHLSFFLLPHNFYPENPALSSRDLVRVERKRNSSGKPRLRLKANLARKDGFCNRVSLKQLIALNPDAVLQTEREVWIA